MERKLIALVTVLLIIPSCKPDLIVTRINTDWDSNHKEVAAEIENKGTSESPPVKIRFMAMKDSSMPGTQSVVIERDLNALQSGFLGSVTVDFEESAIADNGCLADMTAVKVTIDPRDEIKEFNKNNNSLTAPLRPYPRPPLPPEGPSGRLCLKIYSPPATVRVGRPITLQFVIDQDCGVPYGLQQFPLHELRYALYHGSEEEPFFTDTVVLFGETSPVTLDVTPGVQYPPDALPIRVESELLYAHEEGGSAYAQITISLSLINKNPWQIYEQYHDGFLRRHVVESGREIGSVWLKEYEPGKDRAELLWHSRTITLEGRTRVFIPWIHTCGSNGCGKSVEQNADVLYGGDENPLLHSGLAMSIFSNEYLAYGNEINLHHAISIFEYVERSEWKDPTNNYALTGFFLRSNWPGSIDRDTHRESIFASVDELAGMSLGLMNLNRALTVAGGSYANIRSRLINLVDRLGKQLRDNYYFIAPLSYRDGDWHKMGLPLELQRGWAGAYVYQWFFANGFRAITGNDYSVDNRSGALTFFARMQVVGVTEMDIESRYIIERVADWLGPSSFQIAVGAIQGIGVAMYYKSVGLKWTVPIPCFPDVQEVDFSDFKRWNFTMLLHLYQFGMANSSSYEDEHDKLEKQLGPAIWILPDEFYKIKKEMTRLIRGVLKLGGENTELEMDFLLKAELLVLSIIGLPIAPLCDNNPEEHIGTAQAEDDAYAAVIALTYDLIDDQDFQSLVNTAVQHTIANFSKTLPIGDERGLNYVYDASGALVRDHNGNYVWCDINEPSNLEAGQTCKSVKTVEHIPNLNPEGALGKVFCWESFPAERVMDGGGEADGLLNEQIIDSYQQSPSILVMKEGAGFDYLLPMSMLIHRSALISKYENSSNPIFRSYIGAPARVQLDNILGMSGWSSNIHLYDDSRTPYLPICASDPVTVASDASNYFFRPCQLQFPILASDALEFPRRNDSFSSAYSIKEWGTKLNLSLDRYTSWRTTISSPMEYRYVPNAILRDNTGREQRIMPGIDYDFITFQSKYYCRLFVEGITEHHKLVVDGKLISGNSTDLVNLPYNVIQHKIMVSGPLINYRIFIKPQLENIKGDLQISNGSLDIYLLPNAFVPGYQGHLIYRVDNMVLEASGVQQMQGDDYLCIFEGAGELNNVSGHTFRIAVNRRCPRTISVEIKRPDGTIAYSAEGIPYSSGDLHLTQLPIPEN